LTEEEAMLAEYRKRELEILNRIFEDLNSLDAEARQRVLQTVLAYYQVSSGRQSQNPVDSGERRLGQFSEDRSMSPKTFMMQRQPQTDVERVACLAYYLTHYRDAPYFKTLDMSKLNTEAAQPKFSNPTVAMENATKMGYLVPATKGNKQLSAAGEIFVQKLPDREAAKAAMAIARPRRKARRAFQGENQAEGEDE
jgi:hypothetical protein